jgi:heme exporter protein C
MSLLPDSGNACRRFLRAGSQAGGKRPIERDPPLAWSVRCQSHESLPPMMNADATPLFALSPLRLAASPARLYEWAGRLLPWCRRTAALLSLVALAFGLAAAGTENGSVHSYPIAFVHVPAAWMSLAFFFLTAASAAAVLVSNARLPGLVMAATAPAGALFAFVALWTGAWWGQPSPGAWWAWDAGLTSELVLLALYATIHRVRLQVADDARADRACAVLVVLAALNMPIIYFSVSWWNSVHDGGAAGFGGSGALAAGSVAMTFAFWMCASAAVLSRTRHLMLERDPGLGEVAP